jgi:hypothetical protein
MGDPPDPPPPALAELQGYGWRGPLTAESVPRDVAEEIRVLTLNQWDNTAYFMYTDPQAHQFGTMNGPVFDELYAGEYRSVRTLLGNTRLFVSPGPVADAYNGRTYPAGVVAVTLPFALPPVWVVRPVKSLFGGRGWRSGNAVFDKLYHVRSPRMGVQARAAELVPPLVPLISSRDDWAFAFGGLELICVTHDPLGSAGAARQTLDQVIELISLIPQQARVQQPASAPAGGMPMPGGDVDPDAIERHLASMTPEQQAEFVTQMMGGAVPGGLPPGQLNAAIAEAIRRHQRRR